jgi:hypothetical protein
MVFIDKSIIHVVSHLYTRYHSYKMVVPYVILNFKWSSNKEWFPHLEELKIIKRMSHQWVSRSQILCVVSQELYKWCHSNICGGIHNKWRFKTQPSTPIQAFASMRSISFMEIDDKGGEIVQRYESFRRD